MVRFEDMSLKPNEYANEIFNFLNLPNNPKSKAFIQSHTNLNTTNSIQTHGNKHFSTAKESQSIPFQWRLKLTWEDIQNIQEHCKEALEMWGYFIFSNQEELTQNVVVNKSFQI